jgi:HSP20 family molecular chaperone IbpA
MWLEACEMIDRAERLQRQFFQLGEQRAMGPSWQPPVDVFETVDELWIFVALPGVQSARVDITLGDGAVVVTGVRELPRGARKAAIHRLEIPHGRFERRIPLPAGSYQLGHHEMENGCMVLVLGKSPR